MINQLITTLVILTVAAVPYNTSTAVLPSNYEIPQEIKYEAVLTREQVRELVAQYPDWDVETMVKIAQCESSFRKDVINDNPRTGDHSVGIFQINTLGSLAKDRPSVEDLKDPAKNIKFANELYKNGGVNHWKNCYNR